MEIGKLFSRKNSTYMLIGIMAVLILLGGFNYYNHRFDNLKVCDSSSLEKSSAERHPIQCYDSYEFYSNRLIQGPVRPEDDEEYFRKTGITRPIKKEMITNAE